MNHDFRQSHALLVLNQEQTLRMYDSLGYSYAHTSIDLYT